MSWLSSVITGISKVAVTAYGIVKSALPILQALRPAVQEVDDALTFVEEQIAEGGEVADDFLDANIGFVVDLETVANRGVVVMQSLADIAVALRVASQEKTPDTITPEEGEDIGNKILELKELLTQWGPELDAAIASATVAEASVKK